MHIFPFISHENYRMGPQFVTVAKLVQITIITIVYDTYNYMAVCQNLVPLVNIKIAGKWMFIPVLIHSHIWMGL